MPKPLHWRGLRDEPLNWTCPSCVAAPGQKCGDGKIGTHQTRVRLGLYFKYNPDEVGFPDIALAFATQERYTT